MKKRFVLITCLIIVVSIIATLLTVIISAKSDFEISLTSAKITNNAEYELSLEIKNNPGIASIYVDIEIPEGIEIVSVSDTGILNEFLSNSSTSKAVVSWENATNMTQNGTVANVKIKATGEIGSYEINVKAYQVFDENSQTVDITTVNGKIDIVDASGDTNGDGAIETTDLQMLLKKVAGWDVTVENADMNNDGKVDGKDAVLLAQKIRG